MKNSWYSWPYDEGVTGYTRKKRQLKNAITKITRDLLTSSDYTENEKAGFTLAKICYKNRLKNQE